MMIGELSAYLVRSLLLLNRPVKLLEIGTLFGFTTSILCQHCPSEASVISLEEDSETFSIAAENLNSFIQSGKLQLVNEEGIQFLEKSMFKFDFIFLDARKESYFDRLDMIAAKLNQHGILLVDNALAGLSVLNPKDEWQKQTVNFNNAMANDTRFTTTILPIRDGFTLAIRKG
jgi:predicted O-methyltransferase YrrM